MGPDGAFITGSDFLMDGGVTAAYVYGDLAPDRPATRQDDPNATAPPKERPP
jgi:hypothetical protein